jgi:hypothetical protein
MDSRRSLPPTPIGGGNDYEVRLAPRPSIPVSALIALSPNTHHGATENTGVALFGVSGNVSRNPEKKTPSCSSRPSWFNVLIC